MNRSGIPWLRFNLLAAIILMATSMLSPAVLAEEGTAPPESALKVSAFACDSQPLIEVNASIGQVPPDCVPVAGLWIDVVSDFGWVGGCTTLDTGACDLTVPGGYGMTAFYNPANLPISAAPLLTSKYIAQDAGVNDATFIVIKTPVQAPPVVQAEAPVESEQQDEPVLDVQVQSESEQQLPQEDTSVEGDQTEGEDGNEDEGDDEPTTQDETEGDEQAEAEETSTATVTATTTVTATATETVAATTTATATATATTTPTATVIATATVTPSPTTAPVTVTYATVSNTGGAGLRCRTQPNTSSAIITVLAEGTRVETRGAESNGWVPVKCAGQDGWFSTSYVQTTTETSNPGQPTQPSQPSTGSGTVTNTGGAGLRCRAQANTSSATITVLQEGAKVEVRGAASNGWVPVKCAGQDGWVSGSYFSVSSNPGQNPAPAPNPGGGSQTAYVSGTGGGGLNCRTGATTSSGVITVLPEGAKLTTRGSASNGWLPVSCGGRDGYVSTSYVTYSSGGGTSNPTPAPTPNPGSGSQTVTVAGTGGGGLNCRTAPSTGAVITILPEGARVEAIGSAQNGWQQVKCAGQTGWVSISYILYGLSGGGTGAVWIEVDLTRQYMRVYQGDNVINQTYVSTGRYGFDTPPGTFYINWKLPSQTMTGVLGGEYYYVENVPWVMYFTNVGHAIHGAYWHNNFGYRMSHGCVNLPVGFAQWLYGISPVGTRVYIHY
jgi:uncharacterized protein YgiM (DUF1202 family)